jgi:hypothetical protein
MVGHGHVDGEYWCESFPWLIFISQLGSPSAIPKLNAEGQRRASSLLFISRSEHPTEANMSHGLCVGGA